MGGEKRREAKRCDFFSLLLSANKIDRIQNVATKNLFSGKEKKKKNERTRTHTFTNTTIHTYKLNQSKYLELVSVNMSIPTNTSKVSITEDITNLLFPF